MAAKQTQKDLHAKVEAHLVAFVNATEILAPLPRKLDKMFGGEPIVLLAPTREQARALFKAFKAELNYKPIAGYAGLIQNKDDNLVIEFSKCDNKGRTCGEARAADFLDVANEYFIVTVSVMNKSIVGLPADPVLVALRALTDLGGVVKPYEDKKAIGAVVMFPPSFAGTDSVYGGVSNEHKAARLAVIKQLEAQSIIVPGTYTSAYQDSFSLAGFYNANPGTPKWFVTRAK